MMPNSEMLVFLCRYLPLRGESSPAPLVLCSGRTRLPSNERGPEFLSIYLFICFQVWYAMCERKFGSFTNVQDWRGCGRVSYKVVHSVLSHFENLVGFWRGVGNGCHGSLVAFEWQSYKIVGYRVIPARLGSYKVRKVPFIEIGWIGVSQKEMPVCLLDPDWAQLVPESIRNGVNGSSPLSQPLQIPVSPASASQGRLPSLYLFLVILMASSSFAPVLTPKRPR